MWKKEMLRLWFYFLRSLCVLWVATTASTCSEACSQSHCRRRPTGHGTPATNGTSSRRSRSSVSHRRQIQSLGSMDVRPIWHPDSMGTAPTAHLTTDRTPRKETARSVFPRHSSHQRDLWVRRRSLYDRLHLLSIRRVRVRRRTKLPQAAMLQRQVRRSNSRQRKAKRGKQKF